MAIITPLKKIFNWQLASEKISYGGNNGGNNKVYTALISQTGTNAPTAIVLENTLGTVPTFNYEGVGQYSISLNGNFLTVNTFQLIGNNNLGGFDILNIYDNGDDSVWIDTGANDKLSNTPIEIRVYS